MVRELSALAHGGCSPPHIAEVMCIASLPAQNGLALLVVFVEDPNKH